LHQTIIGLEAKKQLEYLDEYLMWSLPAAAEDQTLPE